MILIRNGKIFINAEKFVISDVLIVDGFITEIGVNLPLVSGVRVIDAENLVVSPGLVDMHVHFRDPGLEYKEDIFTGAKAAVAGGVTTCLCMANTLPPVDNPKMIEHLVNKAKQALINVLPCAAVTVGQKGEELTNFAALKASGAKAFSDDGFSIQNAALMRRAMQEAKKNDMLIIIHCEDEDMVQNHGINEGEISKKLGILGRPAIAEEIMVARDVALASDKGARVHIAHVSTAGSVDIIRMAKNRGVAVTAETAPHYFTLTEDEILRQNALARVNPPLRTGADVEAIIRGLQDGTIDAIATDHAPHSMEEKSLPITEAMSGMVGLETSLALALTYLYHTDKLRMSDVIKLMSENPARILGIEAAALNKGSRADIVIFDPYEKWTVDPTKFKSKSRNTPYAGVELKGKVKYTIVNGEVVYES